MQKILIADGTEDFCVTLAEDFGCDVQVKVCCTGREVLELIPEFCPDGIVLDLTLSGSDGLEVLRAISDMGYKAPILTTTRFVSDYILAALEKYNVDYLMVKPCDTRSVVRRMKDMLDYAAPAEIISPEPRNIVSNMLMDLGFSTKRRGFQCLREAILIKNQNPWQSITKELYPAVGEIFEASGEQVEHVIRTAIATAWKNGDKATWERYFYQKANNEIRRPSNGEFISRMAEGLTG